LSEVRSVSEEERIRQKLEILKAEGEELTKKLKAFRPSKSLGKPPYTSLK
jgi:hypothetical protein